MMGNEVAINPYDNSAPLAGADNGPVQPGTNLPVAPSQPQPTPSAPNIPNNPTNLADDIASAWLTHIAARQPDPQPNTTAGRTQLPQQRPNTAVGGALFDALTKGLGDAANAGQGGGGWLSGVERTLSNRDQRVKSEQDRADQKARQQQQDAITLADSHARLIQTNQAIQKQAEDLRHASLNDSQSYVNTFKDAGYSVQSGITQEQLSQRVAQDKDFWANHTGGKTAEVPVVGPDGQPKKDADGNIIYTPSYSIVDLRTAPPDGGNIKITPAMQTYYKTNLGIDYPVDTPLTSQQFASLNAKAHQVADGLRVIEKDNGEALDAKIRTQIQDDMSVSAVTAGLNKYPGRPLKGIAELRSNADAHVAD